MQAHAFIHPLLDRLPMLRTVTLAGLLGLTAALTGCAPLIVGGVAATSATVASDRRSVGEQLDDKTIQMKVSVKLSELLAERGRYNIVSYAGRVLLLGDVPSEADKQQAEQYASEIEQVRDVVNRMRIGAITPFSVRNNDTWLTSKVTGRLINTKNVPTRTISVTTERGVVYLMGKLTQDEARLAAQAASGINGVNQVVTLFHIIDPARPGNAGTAEATDTASDTTSPATEADAASDTDATAGSPVQAMPIH